MSKFSGKIQLFTLPFPVELMQFYSRNGYKGKLKKSDQAWVVLDERGEVVAAARICRQGGERILRGVWVDRPQRGQGLGTQLLTFLAAEALLEGCFCFPFVPLEKFYQRIGFLAVEPPSIYFQKLLSRYNAGVEQVMLMQFPSSQ